MRDVELAELVQLEAWREILRLTSNAAAGSHVPAGVALARLVAARRSGLDSEVERLHGIVGRYDFQNEVDPYLYDAVSRTLG